jgi:hypothetical protein
MRGSRSGFRIRKIVIQVVVVAIVITGFLLERRALVFKELARRHAVLAEAKLIDVKPPPLDLEQYRREWSDYQIQMSHYYQDAASHPWLPLPPEPEKPEPE